MIGQERDWLDRLRGKLPPLVSPVRWTGRWIPVFELYVTGVAQGLAVGVMTGALAGSALFPLFGTVVGAVFGFVVAVPPALILAGAIAVLAARRHIPLQDPRRFHRQVWLILLVGVGVLDLTVVLITAVSGEPVRWSLATVVLAGLTGVVLMLLRPAARRIVVAHAEASGWQRLDQSAMGKGRFPKSMCGEFLRG